MSQMIKPVLIRAYVREGITRIPIDVQKYEIQKAADSLDLEVRWYTGVVAKAKSILEERELWARQTRRDEIGMVHSLPVLRLTRKQIGGKDPKGDFSGLMASMKGLYTMEAVTGLASKDTNNWRQAVAIATEKPPLGSKTMTKKEASEKATKGWEVRNKGVVATWKSGARESERKHLIRHWLASPTAAQALETLPEFIDDMGGGVYEEIRTISGMTLSRICDTKRNT